MKKHSLFILGLGVAGLILSGCGGGGGIGFASPTLSISANLADINYGESITISWHSSQVTSIDTGDTNFSLDGGQVDGSLVGSPGSGIVGRGDDGSSLTKSVTVHVRQSPKKFLYITDVSQAGVPQIQAQLQTLTSLTVDTSLTLPSTISADVIVLGGSGSFGPADQAKITTFLASGGGVVLLGRSPAKLATGDMNETDVSAIGSWLGGVTSTGGSFWRAPNSAVPGVPLSTTTYGDSLAADRGLTPVTTDAKYLSTSYSGAYAAFVYSPSIGGRVGFASNTGLGASSDEVAMKDVFLSACRWVASGN